MQTWCDFQNKYSQRKNDFGVIKNFFHITSKADVGLEKEQITEVPVHYRDQTQQILNDLEHSGITKRVQRRPGILNLDQIT